MRRLLHGLALAVVGMAFLSPTVAHGQFRYVRPQTNPFGTPTISPYLNLGRGGNAGINYYALVRPQVQAFQGIQMLEAQQQSLAEQQQQAFSRFQTGAQIGVSGHRTYFFNYGHYFPRLTGQSQSIGTVGGQPFGRPGQ